MTASLVKLREEIVVG